MSPYEIRLLLHVFTNPGDFEVDKTELFHNTIRDFCDKELIRHTESGGSGYEITLFGEAFIKTILNTPYPKLVYVNGAGEIIK